MLKNIIQKIFQNRDKHDQTIIIHLSQVNYSKICLHSLDIQHVNLSLVRTSVSWKFYPSKTNKNIILGFIWKNALQILGSQVFEKRICSIQYNNILPIQGSIQTLYIIIILIFHRSFLSNSHQKCKQASIYFLHKIIKASSQY